METQEEKRLKEQNSSGAEISLAVWGSPCPCLLGRLGVASSAGQRDDVCL